MQETHYKGQSSPKRDGLDDTEPTKGSTPRKSTSSKGFVEFLHVTYSSANLRFVSEGKSIRTVPKGPECESLTGKSVLSESYTVEANGNLFST